MNNKARVNTIDKLLMATKSSIEEAMIIPQSVWDRLDKPDMTAKSIRDRIRCIPSIREKR